MNIYFSRRSALPSLSGRIVTRTIKKGRKTRYSRGSALVNGKKGTQRVDLVDGALSLTSPIESNTDEGYAHIE